MRKVCLMILLMLPFCAVAGLPSVEYVEDAGHIKKGTLDTARLNVGTAANSVAAGNDTRFETISVGKPDMMVPDGRALIWVE